MSGRLVIIPSGLSRTSCLKSSSLSGVHPRPRDTSAAGSRHVQVLLRRRLSAQCWCCRTVHPTGSPWASSRAQAHPWMRRDHAGDTPEGHVHISVHDPLCLTLRMVAVVELCLSKLLAHVSPPDITKAPDYWFYKTNNPTLFSFLIFSFNDRFCCPKLQLALNIPSTAVHIPYAS